MTLGGAMGASMAFGGATDKEAFEGYYVERFLAPTLSEGHIVVIHRRDG